MTPLDFIHYPITHSLLMAIAWSFVFGFLYYFFKRNGKAAFILSACVLSHWILDLLMHRPDLPLYPGGKIFLGFGLWNYPAIAILIESILFLFCIRLYMKATTPQNGIGKYGFLTLVLLLLSIYIANIFGPSPPSVSAISWAGHLQWLFVVLAYWVDRNRSKSNKQFV
jgi:membrane-bound metal-dependent hydrolase YbcI (DUF457 family)